MKKWYLSKMVWVNALTVLVGTVGYLAGNEIIASNASLVAMLVAVQGAVNVALRFISWQSITG